MTLKRCHDWRERLDRMIDSAREVPFEWGRFDCALHVANCVRAITGCADPAAAYRGKYSDEAGAAAVYGASLEAFIAAQAAALGLSEVTPTCAQRGDVVFVDNGTPQGAVGVVSCDARFASCASDRGMALLPVSRWRRAWRVPF